MKDASICADFAGVDEAKEWGPLLSGDRFSRTQRKHVALIKDNREAPSIDVPGALSSGDDWNR